MGAIVPHFDVTRCSKTKKPQITLLGYLGF